MNTKPELTAQVAAYKTAVDEYNQALDKVNTTYFSLTNSLNGWNINKAGSTAALLEANAKAIDEVYVAAIKRTQELAVVITAFVEAGVDVEAADYDLALWEYHEAVREEKYRPIREFEEKRRAEIATAKKAYNSARIRRGLLFNSWLNESEPVAGAEKRARYEAADAATDAAYEAYVAAQNLRYEEAAA